jgi:hypothetical protein
LIDMARAVLALAAATALWASQAAAGELFAGAYAHDRGPFAHNGYEDSAQLSLGYRTDPIVALRAIGRPSFYGFGAANTGGGLNYAAAGLSWKLGERFYVRPGVGVAIHDGHVGDFQIDRQLNLGSRVVAELELGFGVRINPRLTVEASLVHMSHAQLAGPQNPGLDEVGMRVNYRF